MWAHSGMILLTLLVGPGFTFAQDAARQFSMPLLIGLRLLLSAVLFLPLAWFSGGISGLKFTRAEWRYILLLTLVGVITNQYFFLWGLKYTTPGNSSLLYALTPLLVTCLSVWVIKSEAINGGKITGILLALSGVVLVLQQSGQQVMALNAYLGNAITGIAVCCWAAYIAFSQPLMRRFPPLAMTALLLLIAALLSLPILIYMLLQTSLSTITAGGWFGLLYVTIINSVMGYAMFSWALTRLAASQVSIYTNLQPIVALSFAVLTGRDHLNIVYLTGAILTLGGIYVLNRFR